MRFRTTLSGSGCLMQSATSFQRSESCLHPTRKLARCGIGAAAANGRGTAPLSAQAAGAGAGISIHDAPMIMSAAAAAVDETVPEAVAEAQVGVGIAAAAAAAAASRMVVHTHRRHSVRVEPVSHRRGTREGTTTSIAKAASGDTHVVTAGAAVEAAAAAAAAAAQAAITAEGAAASPRCQRRPAGKGCAVSLAQRGLRLGHRRSSRSAGSLCPEIVELALECTSVRTGSRIQQQDRLCRGLRTVRSSLNGCAGVAGTAPTASYLQDGCRGHVEDAPPGRRLGQCQGMVARREQDARTR